MAQRLGHDQQPGDGRRIVSHARPGQNHPFSPVGQIGLDGKNGVQVGGKDNGGQVGGCAGETAVHIAHLIQRNVAQAGGREPFADIIGPRFFSKSRRGYLLDSDNLGDNVV
jgi:hypothetical protein